MALKPTTGPVRAVLVGCGGMSRHWLSAVRAVPGVALVGFVDIVESAARERAAEYAERSVVIGTDLATVIAESGAHVVFDCTVPAAHVDVTLTALRCGCHVLGEKPLADSMTNAARMVAAARESGLVYAVVQNRRYHPEVRRLKAFLESGVIGPVAIVNADFFIGAHFGGFRDVMPNVLLLDMAIHTFDAARFLCGVQPLAVRCHEYNPAHSWYATGSSATAIFEMERGVIFNYRGSWCAEGLNTSWEGEWRIVGTRGSVAWDGAGRFRAEVVSGERDGIRSRHVETPVPELLNIGYKGEGHAGLIAEFVECIRSGRAPETVCSDNIHSLAMSMAAIESARSGRRETIAI